MMTRHIPKFGMCHGIPRGQLFLRDEIAQAFLDAGDGAADRDPPKHASTGGADVDADDRTPSYLAEEAADANLLTGAMSTENPFDGDGTSPR